MNLIFLDIDGVLNSHKFGRRKLTIEEEQRQIEKLDPVKYNYTGPYSGLQAEHVGQAVLKATEMPTADVLLAEPNEHWTDEAKGVLYPSLTGYSPRGHDSAFSG